MLRSKRTSLFLVGALLAVALGGLVKNSSASAAAAPNILAITPTAARPDVNPGSTTSGSFQVVNQGTTTYDVKVYAAPYSVQTEAYTPDFSPLPGKPDVASWLQFSVDHGTVKGNQDLTVHYTLTVPSGTLAGGYYAVAFAETQLPKDKGGVVVNERVGELFYIQVNGPVKQSGKLLTWSSNFFQKPPLAATMRVENEGGVHYVAGVHVTVSDMFGSAKYTLDAEKEILPQTIRKIPVSWTKAPAFGMFKVGGNVTILGKQQKLGTKYVLVMSDMARIVVLIIVVLFIAAVTLLSVRKRKHKTKQPKESAAGKK